jgi:hypothetical protein
MPSQYGVFDEVTGKRVGAVTIDRHVGKRRVFRTVALFDERYSGSFDTHTECIAFVKGVEAVLNDILKAKNATGDGDAEPYCGGDGVRDTGSAIR